MALDMATCAKCRNYGKLTGRVLKVRGEVPRCKIIWYCAFFTYQRRDGRDNIEHPKVPDTRAATPRVNYMGEMKSGMRALIEALRSISHVSNKLDI